MARFCKIWWEFLWWRDFGGHFVWIALKIESSWPPCGSLLVESKWCHYIMVEVDSHLKLLPSSTLYIYKVFEHIDMLPWAYGSYTPKCGSYFWVWVTCGVKMMSLCHDWGWQPPQTASCIHIRLMKCVWSHWYAVHGHMVVASYSYTHTTWVRLWVSGSLVESKWCHYIMVEPYSHLKLLPASTFDIYKVFEHFNMLFMGI